MEPIAKKSKPDPELEIAMEAGLNGDYRPIAELMKWKGVTDAEEFQKRLLRAFVDSQTDNTQLRFMSDKLLCHEVFNNKFDPDFDTSAEPAGSNTKNNDWPVVPARYIEEMDDYTFETLQEQLGFMFSIKTGESRDSIATSHNRVKAYLKPTTEAEIQHVAQSYLLPMIESCIRGDKSLLGSTDISNDTSLVMKGIEGFMEPETGTTVELDNEHYRFHKRKGNPDWSIYLLLKGKEKRYVTMGETKMDSKWMSSWLPKQQGEKYQNAEAPWPLRQQANYCYDGNTSWSFIYTPKEVVLCRFYIIPNDKGQVSGDKRPCLGLYWKSVPVSGHTGPDTLGPVVAIWSWIIFAFLDQNRALCTRDKLRKLSDIVPKQMDGNEMLILSEALKTAEEGLKAVEQSGVIEVADAIKINGPTKRKRGPKQAIQRSNVWEGRLRPRNGNVVIGVGIA